ncbi:MAG: hypothetical protein WAU68_09515 [Vitreimonas sp.]
MNRRSFALSLGTTLVGATVPTLAVGQSTERVVDANRVFAHLLDYYRLPAGERSHFHLVFKLRAETGETPPISIASAGARRALNLNRDGAVLNPPTAAELQGDGQVIIGGPSRMSAALSLAPLLALGASVAAADAISALTQANAAIGRFAGPMGMFAPRLNGVGFVAPRSAAGTALFADARQAPMPYAHARFEFRPSSLPNVRALNFMTAPTDAVFLQ